MIFSSRSAAVFETNSIEMVWTNTNSIETGRCLHVVRPPLCFLAYRRTCAMQRNAGQRRHVYVPLQTPLGLGSPFRFRRTPVRLSPFPSAVGVFPPPTAESPHRTPLCPSSLLKGERAVEG
jgi:hypothetical protein